MFLRDGGGFIRVKPNLKFFLLGTRISMTSYA